MARKLTNGTNLINAPALNGRAVTPSDTVDMLDCARGVYVGTAGDLKVITIGGDTITFVGLVAGVIHPICAARIFATGTTADNIVAVY